MIADGLDRMVLLLLVAGGAALFLGVVGIVSPTWAADHAAFLTLAGGAVPFLAVVTVHIHQSVLDGAASRNKQNADTELTLARAEAARMALERTQTPLPDSPAPEPPADDRGWYLAIEITLLAGQVAGFTDNGLTPIMGSDARPKMQRFLEQRGVLELRPQGYGWKDGVTLADALRRLRANDLAPYPAEAAPEVKAPLQPATRRDAPRQAAKGEKRIIEGVRAD